MTWHLGARIGQEIKHYTLTDNSPLLVEAGRSPWKHPPQKPQDLGQIQDLLLSLAGQEAPFDLLLSNNNRDLTLENIHITSSAFAHIPTLDAFAVVTGDPGSNIPRRVSLFSLQPLRDALAQGLDRLNAAEIDQCGIHGAVNGIDVERPELRIWPINDSPELAFTWNQPGAQPARASLKVVLFPDYRHGARLASLRALASKELPLEQLWLTHLFNARDAHGALRVWLAGVGRKRRDFCLALRTISLPDRDYTLYKAVQDLSWDHHQLDQLLLRDASGVKAAVMLPQARGLILSIEDQMRRRSLCRLDLHNGTPRVTPLQGPSSPDELCLLEAAQITTPSPTQETPQTTVTTQQNQPQAASAANTLATPTLAAAPTPSATNTRLLWSGAVTASPAGAQIDLGPWPDDLALFAQPIVLGDGRWARVLCWLSQQPEGDSARYTLHLEAAREVQLRVLVWSA